ncbi:MAG: hypothetical protein ACFFCV_04840 [Promethearchaeota archaeon]
MLSPEGWISFISILLVMLIGFIFSIRLIFESIRRHGKLLFFAGLMIISMSLYYLGPLIDFVTIFLTDSNFANKEFLAISSNITTGSLIITQWYVLAELVTPKYKKYIVALSVIVCSLCELFLFLDPLGSIRIILPQELGEMAQFFPMLYASPFYIITTIAYSVSILFVLIGFIYKTIKSTGIIKKKYLFLLIALSLYLISITLFTYYPRAIFFTILNVLVFVSFGFLYLALKEESVKKPKPRKEVKIKDEIFRISKYRQEEITEEDVSISKERKICIVCKGKAIRFNIFICSGCETVYCENCARALSDLENACWVCGAPFDELKPSRIYTNEDFMPKKRKKKKNVTIITKKSNVDIPSSQNE